LVAYDPEDDKNVDRSQNSTKLYSTLFIYYMNIENVFVRPVEGMSTLYSRLYNQLYNRLYKRRHVQAAAKCKRTSTYLSAASGRRGRDVVLGSRVDQLLLVAEQLRSGH